tara:strand:- start:784 stop:1305 length:522 start_codon:yes stop_codon:yes gene_type:complete
MAAKIKTNDYGDCIYTEQDALDLLYTNPEFDISKLFFESPDQYNESVLETGMEFAIIKKIPNREPLYEFDQINCNKWHMPEKYYDLNVLDWLLDKCQSEQEKIRVKEEYNLFDKKKFVKVLQFLIYFVDTLRANNVVWGVGRGSSVSSFCLFLIGVHKINPMLYNLDYKEFLR